MSWEDHARTAAGRLQLLDERGDLRPIGSLEIVDYVVELEDSTGLHIPSARLHPSHFQSLATVVALLEAIAAGGEVPVTSAAAKSA